MDRVPVPGDAATLHDQPDQTALGSVGSDPLERSPPDEVDALVELHDPTEAGVIRRGRRIELVAVKRHAGFQPERVACTEADGTAVDRADRLHQRVPQLAGPSRLDEDLET